jgi:PIN domain nuclease of toxin-antitoxin system
VTKYLLDTHIWIWWNAKPDALPEKAKQLIANGNYDELLLSAISIWEFSKLLEKGRLKLSCDGLQWISQALKIPRLRIVDLTPEIAWQSTCLPQPFHDDPADQIIVATARNEKAILISADRLIRRYPHVRSEG